MIIGIIAVDRNGAIGKNGKLPWHYSADLKFFKQTTIGHACVMGHHTWLSIGKPLPNRLNIVLSRSENIEPRSDVIFLRSVDAVLKKAEDLNCDLFVIGGEQIYRAFLQYIDKWIVTNVPLEVEGADAFAPANYLDGFRLDDTRELGEGLTVSFYTKPRLKP